MLFGIDYNEGMKKIKSAILSFLLLSFCFVSFHDYLIADNQAQEVSCSEIHLEKEQALKSVVHDSLHHLLVYFDNSTFSCDAFTRESPSFTQANMSHHKTSVLLRPPLS